MAAAEQGLALPADAGGFVRRRCKRCQRVFKVRWSRADAAMLQRSLCALYKHANDAESTVPPERSCPYCGTVGPASAFWTEEQETFLREQAESLRADVRYWLLRQAEERLGENPYITFIVVRPDHAEPELPPEPDDMRVFHLVCCGEPLKLRDEWAGEVHCPFCRAVHSVGS